MTDDLTATRGDTREAPDERDGMSENEAALQVCGEHAADRLIRSQKLSAGSPYLGGEKPPTPGQIGAVLHALADHTLLMHLLSPTVTALGEDRAHFGPGWRESTALGRALQLMGSELEFRTATPTPPPTGPLVDPVAVAEAGGRS